MSKAWTWCRHREGTVGGRTLRDRAANGHPGEWHLLGATDPQLFALCVARAAGAVEAPPRMAAYCRRALRLPRSSKLWPPMGHSTRAAFGLRSEPAPNPIRG